MKHTIATRKKLSRLKKAWWRQFSSAQRRARTKHIHQRGPASNSWKGGKAIDGNGYVKVKLPSHPYAHHDGYVFEHRLVMEKMIGRYLHPKEHVHHRNGQRTDNRPKNLLLVSTHAHWEKHGCPKCGFEFCIR